MAMTTAAEDPPHQATFTRNEKVREEDLDSLSGRTLRMELVDLHRRLSGVETNLGLVKDEINGRLHQIELKLAQKVPLPAWAGAVLVFTIAQLGATIWWGSQVSSKVEDIPLIESNCDDNRSKLSLVKEVQQVVLQRLSAVESHTKEVIGDHWTKSDDRVVMDGFKTYVDQKFSGIEHRVLVQEQRSIERDKWWQQFWASGLMKGHTP